MNIFSVILALLCVLAGVCWYWDFKNRRPQRKAAVKALLQKAPDTPKKQIRDLMEPKGFVGGCGSLFVIFLVIFLLRAFLIEPFRIPSGSMLPTLQSGDFIAVSKYSYGIRNPFTGSVLIKTGAPERGDVVVFKYPEDPSVDYIKRVVGLPGDVIIYAGKQLYILPDGSGSDARPQLIERRADGTFSEKGPMGDENYDVYQENLLGMEHRIMVNPNAPDLHEYFFAQDGLPRGAWKVPADTYFVMGDNRDNSKDSRFWGFVPYDNLVGRTFGIWLSFDFDRGSDSVLPSWVPTSFNFSRLGGLH